MKKIPGLDRILLVDDDEMANFIHLRAIKKAEIDVVVDVARNALEALEVLKESNKGAASSSIQPNLIFLDINMPFMDGWEFLDEYKKIFENRQEQIIILMLTTSLNPDDEKRSESRKEISMFLNKPLTTEKLETVLQKFF